MMDNILGMIKLFINYLLVIKIIFKILNNNMQIVKIKHNLHLKFQ
jgi:hypothetical protein